MITQHHSLTSRLVALLAATALLACGLIVARADAASPLDGATAPSAGQVLLTTDSYQVVATSPTTADMIGQGADAAMGRFHVQFPEGSPGTTPVEFWAELWKFIKGVLGLGASGGTKGCVTWTKEVTSYDAHGRPVRTKTTVTIC